MKAPSVKLPLLHRGKAGEPPGIVAVARVDRRTKNITKRLSPGEIAIIDHSDLDRVSAEELIRRKVAAVVNASVSITGRYPNLGPKLLLEAGIPVVDGVGQDVLVKVTDGAVVRLDEETLYLGDTVVAKGTPLTEELVQTAMTEARAMVGVQIESFAANTLEFLRREHELLTRGIEPPEMDTDMNGRHVLVVVRGYHYREDLAALRPYIREYKPVMVAVDGGADALIEAGYQPDAILGDMDSVSDEALCCGAELVVHAYPDGRAPGLARVRELGLDAVTLPVAGDERRRRPARRRRQGGQPDRGGGYPSHARGVPRQGQAGDVEHVHHAPAGGREAGQRARRAPAVPQPDLRLVAAGAGARRGGDRVRRRRVLARQPHPGQVLRSDLAFVYLLADRKTLVIDFRYHLVSIVAVFLALAIGIVLGSTELQGPAFSLLDKTTSKLQSELGQVSSQRDTAQQQATEGELYAQAVEPAVLRDLLTGHRLLIVTEPGAQSSVVSGITTAAIHAGATVTGQINLQPKFFDTSGTAQDSLNQTTLDVAQPAGIAAGRQRDLPAAGRPGDRERDPDQRAGVRGRGQPAGGDQGASTDASTMLQAYAASQFLSTSGQPATPATLAVVVTPQNAPSDGSADQLDQVLVPLVQELAAKSAATVVVGSSAGSGAGSPIAVLRSNSVASQVSTVDDADLAAGQTVAMQALAVELAGGKAGSYGFTANGASAIAPSPAPTPSALRERDTHLLDDKEEGQEMSASGIRSGGRCLRGGCGQARLLRHEPAPAGRPEGLVTHQPPGRACHPARGARRGRRGHRRRAGSRGPGRPGRRRPARRAARWVGAAPRPWPWAGRARRPSGPTTTWPGPGTGAASAAISARCGTAR